MRHWGREGPPIYISAAAYLGLRKSKVKPADLIDGQDLENLLSAFPGGERTQSVRDTFSENGCGQPRVVGQ